MAPRAGLSESGAGAKRPSINWAGWPARRAGSRRCHWDLASLDSVRTFAAGLTGRLVAGTLPPLHGLVCNAGVQSGTRRTVTADGFESTFGVNHLGHFLLVSLLLPILMPPARVAVVSSGTHDPAKKNRLPAPAWNEPAALSRGELGPAAAADGPFIRGQRLYATSKLANLYFTYALARRIPAGVTANAFDPGLVPGTGLQRDAPALIRFIAKHVLPHTIPLLRRIFNPNVHTLEESGASLARLLTTPPWPASTGKYFEGRREIRSSPESYDEGRAEELWKASGALQPAILERQSTVQNTETGMKDKVRRLMLRQSRPAATPAHCARPRVPSSQPPAARRTNRRC